MFLRSLISILCISALTLSAMAGSGCASQSDRSSDNSAPKYGYRVERGVVYTPANWPARLGADVYVPEGNGPFPGVLLAHGGGWEGRSRADMEGIAEQLAERGFTVVNASYRFAPAYRFPAQLHDMQQAVRWMRVNATRYRIERARIGAFGYSAGAQLVALLGTIGPADALDRPYGGGDTRIQAVVAGGTPADLRKFKGGRLVPQYLGTTQAQNAAIFALASPITHVTPDDPPMFLYHGSGDTLVDISHSQDMKAALDAAGVPAELYVVGGLGHISTFLFNRSAVDAGIAFLDRRLRIHADVARRGDGT